MQIAFLGHVAIDENIVKGKPQYGSGGGVFYGGIAAARLGAKVSVLTKCAPEHRDQFAILDEVGIDTVHFDSATSTKMRNEYPTSNPDDRISRSVERAAPFSEQDLDGRHWQTLHLSPLWLGEFPGHLIPKAKARTDFLAADAQGFLRFVAKGGRLECRDWEEKRSYLPSLDLLKVDRTEAAVLTGIREPRRAARALWETGVGCVLLTRREGVLVFDGESYYESEFGEYTIAGRTGRGDTCTASFLVARATMGIAEATEFAAQVTTAKMQYPGPFRGGERPEDFAAVRSAISGGPALPVGLSTARARRPQ